MSGCNLGDRGECARCRNGDIPMRRCVSVFGSLFFYGFFEASLCNGRVTDECPWCFKYGHVAPSLPKWARLAFVKRQFEIWAYPFWRPVCADVSCAAKRRSRCGVFRGWPVLSSHFSPGFVPQGGHRTANICFGLLFTVAPLCRI